MRSILLLSLLGALAAPASADWTPTMSGNVIGFGFRYRDRDKGISVGVGYRDGYRNGYRHRHRHWVPGHYDVVTRRVWVPGAHETVWQPAEWGWRHDACGGHVRYLVRPAGYVTIHHPGHWDYVQERVWVPGHYAHGH
jgi:hypothetical protein